MKTTLLKLSLLCGIFLLLLGVYFYLNRTSIDVIIPVYNSSKFLPRCLDSVFSQSGKFKVIAVNDGSTDNSLQILNQYAKKHKNMIVINQKNQGVAVARNNALKLIKGKYVTFVDSDDWLEPNAFSEILKIIKKDKSEIVLTGIYDVYDKQWVRDITGKIEENIEDESKFPSRKLDKLSLFTPFKANTALNELFYVGTGIRGQFFQTEFIRKYNITFPEKISTGEDDIFLYRSFLNNPIISITTRPIYNYRNRLYSLAKSKNVLQNSIESFKVLEQTKEYKNADRRTRMFLKDTWLSWMLLGLSNLQRFGYPYGTGLDTVHKVYESFSIYNKEELKSCRNYQKLKLLFFNDIN